MTRQRTLERCPTFPATFMQRRLYDITERHPDAAMRHVTAAFEFPEHLDAERLRVAIGELMARHDALRMRFSLDENGTLCAHDVVTSGEDVETVLTVIDHAGARSTRRSGEAGGENPPSGASSLDKTAVKVALSHFNRTDEPPWRVVLSRGERGDLLIVAVDHLVCDARSLRILLDDLTASYDEQGLSATGSPRFGDFLEDEAGQAALAQEEIAFWATRYRSVPSAYSVRLPFAIPGHGAAMGTAAFEELTLDAPMVGLLRKRATANRLSPFGAALTALNTCLAPHADDRAVAVTGVLPNRRDGIYDGTVGSFAHTTAYVTSKPEGMIDYPAWALASRRAIIDTLRHSRLALFDLIGRLGVGGSLASRYGYGIYVDYLYASLDTSRFALGGVPGTETRLDSGVNKSLSLWVIERGDGILLKANFEAERFTRRGVREFLTQFAAGLTGTDPDVTAALGADERFRSDPRRGATNQ